MSEDDIVLAQMFRGDAAKPGRHDGALEVHMRAILIAVCIAGLSACSRAGSPEAVCRALEAEGVAANCKKGEPGGLGAGAVEKWDFDLPSVAGKTGQVLAFDDDEKYAATVKAFDAAKVLAGPHRYGNPGKRVFVQMNDGLSDGDGKKARAVVDGLGGS